MLDVAEDVLNLTDDAFTAASNQYLVACQQARPPYKLEGVTAGRRPPPPQKRGPKQRHHPRSHQTTNADDTQPLVLDLRLAPAANGAFGMN